MGVGCLREVVTHGGSTVCLLNENSRSSLEVVHLVAFKICILCGSMLSLT